MSAGENRGADGGAQVDVFPRQRLTLDDVRERLSLPGGHRDRVVLATSLWSDHMVLTPWRLLRVEESPSGKPRVIVRLATDPQQPEQYLPLEEQRLYGLAPEGV